VTTLEGKVDAEAVAGLDVPADRGKVGLVGAATVHGHAVQADLRAPLVASHDPDDAVGRCCAGDAVAVDVGLSRDLDQVDCLDDAIAEVDGHGHTGREDAAVERCIEAPRAAPARTRGGRGGRDDAGDRMGDRDEDLVAGDRGIAKDVVLTVHRGAQDHGRRARASADVISVRIGSAQADPLACGEVVARRNLKLVHRHGEDTVGAGGHEAVAGVLNVQVDQSVGWPIPPDHVRALVREHIERHYCQGLVEARRGLCLNRVACD